MSGARRSYARRGGERRETPSNNSNPSSGASVADALDRLASFVKFVSAAAEKVRNRGRPLRAYENVGADDLLPALT